PLERDVWDAANITVSIEDGEVVGAGLRQIGRFEEARPWYERAVAEKEKANEQGQVDQTSLGLSLHQVGFCLSRVGKFDEARSWYERAVAATEQGDLQGQVEHESLA